MQPIILFDHKIDIKAAIFIINCFLNKIFYYNFSPREELQHGKNKTIKEKTKKDQ